MVPCGSWPSCCCDCREEGPVLLLLLLLLLLPLPLLLPLVPLPPKVLTKWLLRR